MKATWKPYRADGEETPMSAQKAQAPIIIFNERSKIYRIITSKGWIKCIDGQVWQSPDLEAARRVAAEWLESKK